MAMTIVVIVRAVVLGKRGKNSVVEAGPATSALARLIMSHDREKHGKITPVRLQLYEAIAATAATSAGPSEEFYELIGQGATQRGPR